MEYATSTVFGMACLAGSEVNIQQDHLKDRLYWARKPRVRIIPESLGIDDNVILFSRETHETSGCLVSVFSSRHEYTL